MNIFIVFFLSLFIIFLLFFFLNNLLTENFYVRKRLPVAITWTPYVYDYANQPSYSNYFYDNGYMYPIY
jgi:hypothetical protein